MPQDAHEFYLSMLSALSGLRIAREVTTVIPAPTPIAPPEQQQQQQRPGGVMAPPSAPSPFQSGAGTSARPFAVGGGGSSKPAARPADSTVVPSFLLRGGEDDGEEITSRSVRLFPLLPASNQTIAPPAGGAAVNGAAIQPHQRVEGGVDSPQQQQQQVLHPAGTECGSASAQGYASSTIGVGEDDEKSGEGLVEAVFGGLLRSDVTCMVRLSLT